MEEILRLWMLDCAARYEAATGVSSAAIGKRALNDNTFFARIRNGQGFTTRTYDRVADWFAANWPQDVAQPAQPVSSPEVAA